MKFEKGYFHEKVYCIVFLKLVNLPFKDSKDDMYLGKNYSSRNGKLEKTRVEMINLTTNKSDGEMNISI